MTDKISRFTSETLPELSPEQIESLRILADMPDRSIDLTDIPQISPVEASKSVRGRFYVPERRQPQGEATVLPAKHLRAL